MPLALRSAPSRVSWPRPGGASGTPARVRGREPIDEARGRDPSRRALRRPPPADALSRTNLEAAWRARADPAVRWSVVRSLATNVGAEARRRPPCALTCSWLRTYRPRKRPGQLSWRAAGCGEADPSVPANLLTDARMHEPQERCIRRSLGSSRRTRYGGAPWTLMRRSRAGALAGWGAREARPLAGWGARGLGRSRGTATRGHGHSFRPSRNNGGAVPRLLSAALRQEHRRPLWDRRRFPPPPPPPPRHGRSRDDRRTARAARAPTSSSDP